MYKNYRPVCTDIDRFMNTNNVIRKCNILVRIELKILGEKLYVIIEEIKMNTFPKVTRFFLGNRDKIHWVKHIFFLWNTNIFRLYYFRFWLLFFNIYGLIQLSIMNNEIHVSVCFELVFVRRDVQFLFSFWFIVF